MADNKKFYFNIFIDNFTTENLSDYLKELLVEDGFGGIADESLEDMKKSILDRHAERFQDDGVIKRHYPIYEISVREIGYCTAIAETRAKGEIITTY